MRGWANHERIAHSFPLSLSVSETGIHRLCLLMMLTHYSSIFHTYHLFLSTASSLSLPSCCLCTDYKRYKYFNLCQLSATRASLSSFHIGFAMSFALRIFCFCSGKECKTLTRLIICEVFLRAIVFLICTEEIRGSSGITSARKYKRCHSRRGNEWIHGHACFAIAHIPLSVLQRAH